MYRPDYEKRQCFGLWDKKKEAWKLDCFDWRQLFDTRDGAERYLANFDPERKRYEVKPHDPAIHGPNRNEDP